MKPSAFSVVVLILVLLPASISKPEVSEAAVYVSCIESEGQISYLDHEPVLIQSNADFVIQGWLGTGTRIDPYVIENLEIVSNSSCIRISDTTCHFVIRNCHLSSVVTAQGQGINLQNAPNGRVEQCNITLKSYGVLVDESHGFKLANSTIRFCESGGIRIIKSMDCEVLSNEICNSGSITESEFVYSSGVQLDYSHNCTIAGNEIQNSTSTGINTLNSEPCIILNNSISDCLVAGVHMSQLSGSIIANNTLVNNGFMFYVSDKEDWNFTFNGNTVNCKPVCYLHSESDTLIDGGQFGQVILFNCSNIKVAGGQFYRAAGSIQLQYCWSCEILDNVAIGCSTGFFIHASHDCRVQNNTISDSHWFGLRLHGVTDCIVTNNTFRKGRSGIDTRFSHGCFVVDNIIEESTDTGIHFEYSIDCRVTSNVFRENARCLAAFDSNNISICENSMASTGLGVCIVSCENCTVVDNSLNASSGYGFLIDGSTNCNVSSNYVVSQGAYNLYLSYSTGCTITQNVFVGNGVYIGAEYDTWYWRNPKPIHWCHYISGNTVNGRSIGYYWGIDSKLIRAENCAQIIVANSTDVTVVCNSTDQSSVWVQLAFCNACCVENSTIYGHEFGIMLYGSQSCRIVNSTVCYSETGLLVQRSSGCLTASSTFFGNGRGMSIDESDDFRIEYCTVSGNADRGIFVVSSDYFVAFRNNVSGNSDGICLYYSNGATVVGNTILRNSRYGIIIWGPSSSNSLYWNLISHNGMANAVDSGEDNLWDDGFACGNHWGNYNDTQDYAVSGSAGSNDRFPNSTWPYPVITVPSSFECVHGLIGLNVVWNLTVPLSYFSYVVSNYTILVNGTAVECSRWNGFEIDASLDGLQVGTYNFTLVIDDSFGNRAISLVIVRILHDNETPPSFNWILESILLIALGSLALFAIVLVIRDHLQLQAASFRNIVTRTGLQEPVSNRRIG